MRKNNLKKIGVIFSAIACCALANADEIKHRFLVGDEPNKALVHIDQNNPENNWKVGGFDKKCWDVRLFGNNQAIMPTTDGYKLIDLNGGKILKTVKFDGITGIWSVVPKRDGGKAVFYAQKGQFIAMIDANDKVINTFKIPEANGNGLLRIADNGNLLHVGNYQFIETTPDGKIVNKFPAPKGIFGKPNVEPKKYMNAFMSAKDADGNYWISSGYGAAVSKTDANGKILKEFGLDQNLHFAGAFQILKNGNIVQSNWCGHKVEAAKDGAQLFEFNQDGEVVWSFHDTKAFACPLTVIILDDIDTSKPAFEKGGVLQN